MRVAMRHPPDAAPKRDPIGRARITPTALYGSALASDVLITGPPERPCGSTGLTAAKAGPKSFMPDALPKGRRVSITSAELVSLSAPLALSGKPITRA